MGADQSQRVGGNIRFGLKYIDNHHQKREDKQEQ